MLEVFAYWKGHLKFGIVINPKERKIQEAEDMVVHWNEQYPRAKEEVPQDMPIPKQKDVKIVIYVDAGHAHDFTITCRSVTALILFINDTPMKWYSKR